MFRALILSLTILSLLNLQLTGFGFISSAEAQVVAQATATPDSSLLLNPSVTNQQSTNAKAQNKALIESKVKSYQTKEEPTGVKKIFSAEGFLNVLMMFSIAYVGKSLMFACKEARSQADVIAFAAGAAAFVAGELQAWIRYKKLEDVRVDYVDGALSGEQRKALEGQREAYQQMLSIAKTKYMLQLAAATAFATAAGLAAYRHFYSESEFKTCTAAIKTLDKNCSAYCASMGPHAERTCNAAARICHATVTKSDMSISGAKDKANQAISTASLWGSLKELFNFVKPENSSNCGGPVAPCAMGTTTLCNSVYSKYETSWVVCNPISMYAKSDLHFLDKALAGVPVQKIALPKTSPSDFWGQKNLELVAQKFFNMVVPQAQAMGGFMDLLGLTATGYVILTGLNQTHATWFDEYMFNPLKRSMIFGICAGLATTTAMMTKKNMSKIEENIAKIDEILKTMGSSTTVSALAVNQNAQIPIAAEIPSLSKSSSQATFPCVMVGNVKQNCGSLASAYKNANQSDLKTNGMTFDGIGSAMSQLGQLSAQMADGIQGQGVLSQGTLANAENLANQNALANKNLKAMYKALDDQALKNGKPALGLEGMNKKVLGNVQAAAYKSLKAKGVDATSAAAALGMMDPLSKSEAKKEGAIDEKALSSVSSNTSGGGVAVQSGLPSFGGDLLPKGDEAATASDSTVSNTLPEGTEVDESKVGDINNTPEKNIFEIITQRYFRTGLDKLGIQTKAEPKKDAPSQKNP